MSYAALASFLLAGHPEENTNNSSVGNLYIYRGVSATLSANKPAVGDAWADARPVTGVRLFEFTGASGISELTVITGVNVSYSGSIGTAAVEQIHYDLRWKPLVKPLEVNPAFASGGAKALDATAWKHIIGWRAEVDPNLRSLWQYRALDSDGVPSGTTTTASGNGLDFIKLLMAGVEEFIDYMPIWAKRSVYIGSSAPNNAAIGAKGTPSGSGYPSGYEWVKSADNVERIGLSARWKRDEEWEGAIKVYADKSTVYVP